MGRLARLAVALGSVGALIGGVALVATKLVELSNVMPELAASAPKFSESLRQFCSSTGICPARVVAAPPGGVIAPLPNIPAGVSPPVEVRTFIVVAPGAEGAAVRTAVSHALQGRGIQIAADRDHAGLLVEIGPPLSESGHAGGAAGDFSAAVTLTARVSWTAEGATDVAAVQRQARGFGSTEAEATRGGIEAAALRLGDSIAEGLKARRAR